MKETSVDYVRDAKRINYYIKYDPALPVDTGKLKRHIMTKPIDKPIKLLK